MAYPYYQDPVTGVPTGRFSAPMSRANISNPITPHGIPYYSPTTAPSNAVQPERKPSRLKQAASFLRNAALVGGAAYLANQFFKDGGGDDGGGGGDKPNYDDGNVVDMEPVRDKVQKFLTDGLHKGDIDRGDVDLEGRPINWSPTPKGPKYPGGRGSGGDYMVSDPEEVGGLRTKKSKALLSKFRKNIPTTEGRPQTEHPGLDEEIIGISPKQAQGRETWTSIDNDRFFDHPDADTLGVPDEISNVPDAGKQHLDSYTNDEQGGFYRAVTALPDKSGHVSGVSLYPKEGVTTWNLKGRDGGTSPYTYHTPSPIMLALAEMTNDGTLSKESLGSIHNTLTGKGAYNPDWGKKDLGQLMEAMDEEKVHRAAAKDAGTKAKSYKAPYGSLLTKIAKFDPKSPAHLPDSSQRLSEDLERVRYDKDQDPWG